MREILFRGKRVDNGEWVEGCYIKGVKACFGKAYILPEDINQPGCHHLDGFNVIPETVGQFTGILDKNGKKIFEGDVIESDQLKPSKVEFYNGMFSFWDMSFEEYRLIYESDELEIIGNIHDNPELL